MYSGIIEKPEDTGTYKKTSGSACVAGPFLRIRKGAGAMADIEKKMRDMIQQGGTAAEPPEDARLFGDTTAGGAEQEREEETGERERAGEMAANSSATDEKENPVNTSASNIPDEPEKKKRKYNTQNLRPTTQMTETERREFARIGGLASAKKRAEKKNLQKLLSVLLSTPATAEMKEKAARLGFSPEEANTVYDAMNVALIDKALSGDGYAYQLIRDSAGDRPTERVEQAVSVMTEKDVEMMRKLNARLEKSATDGQK